MDAFLTNLGRSERFEKTIVKLHQEVTFLLQIKPLFNLQSATRSCISSTRDTFGTVGPWQRPCNKNTCTREQSY